jgi:hypothetical protein
MLNYQKCHKLFKGVNNFEKIIVNAFNLLKSKYLPLQISGEI